MARSQLLATAVLLVATAMILMASSSEAARILKLNDGAGAAVNTVPESLNIALPGEDSGCSMFEKVPGLAGKYGPTLLNALPKGRLPPSGPSKGTNDVNN